MEAKDRRNRDDIIAILTQPFGATTDDWNIPHDPNSGGVDQATQWLNAGYTTSGVATAGEALLTAAANAFPKANLKLPIQAEGTVLDGTGCPWPPSVRYDEWRALLSEAVQRFRTFVAQFGGAT